MLQLLLSGNIALFVLILTALVISLSFHEFGHAFAALKFGDDTAKRLGRLTINPIAHIDPMGLMMVVLIGFGYAKPVPTNPRNFNSMWAQLVIAAAGPIANLIIAIVAWNLWNYGLQAGWNSFMNDGATQFFSVLVLVNLLLMVFNLIPIGPLDGHYILPYFLPKKIARSYTELNARYGHFLLLGLVLLSFAGVPIFSYVQQVGWKLLPYITFI